jgi:hypothetical protein
MNKRLLTKDYKRIVLDSFNIPKSDWYKYYLNLVESNYQYNTDIIEQLIEILNEFVEINKSEVYGGLVPVENKNGKIEYVDINQTFEVDENGNKTPFNLEEPLFPFQIKTIGIIKDAISLKNNLIEYENKLPEPIRKYFKENPMPEGFDFSDLKKRVEIISQIPELLKQHKEALQKIINEKNQDETRKLISEHYALAYIFDCHSIGESIPYGSKTKLEEIGNKRVKVKKT